MEDNNNMKGKKSVVDVSVVLSFVVAIFAVFSLAMAGITMNQKSGVSYAAPTELADSFTFDLLNDGDHVLATNSNDDSMFNVPMYIANNDPTNPIFCVEHTAPVDDGASYSKGEAIEDYGLLYLLNNSYANGQQVTDVKGENAKYVEAWVTQTAIWLYLYEKNPESTADSITAEQLAGIKNATRLTKYSQGVNTAVPLYNGDNLYETYVKPLVNKAKSATDVATVYVSKDSDEISLVEDKKFYDSSVIVVTGDPSSALKSYDIDLKGIEGAKAVNEKGEEISTGVAPGTKFYVRIPAEKVTKEVQKVTVTINATFDTLTGNYYNAATQNLQKVVSVKAGTKTISSGTEVEFVGTDDTGMSATQTIYFIGLIVLLCGVGIVYANAKPVQVKQ